MVFKRLFSGHSHIHSFTAEGIKSYLATLFWICNGRSKNKPSFKSPDVLARLAIQLQTDCSKWQCQNMVWGMPDVSWKEGWPERSFRGPMHAVTCAWLQSLSSPIPPSLPLVCTHLWTRHRDSNRNQWACNKQALLLGPVGIWKQDFTNPDTI